MKGKITRDIPQLGLRQGDEVRLYPVKGSGRRLIRLDDGSTHSVEKDLVEEVRDESAS